jgi:predicted dinucleotide-binding enzyme
MRIAIIGTGMIGGTLARKLAAAGYPVVVANRRGAASLRDLVAEIGDRATAATPVEAAAEGDIVIAAVPFKAVADLPATQLDGKVVIDTSNYYPQRDGHVEELDSGRSTSSELTARTLPGARVVKAFNTLYYERLRDNSRPAGASDRLVVLLAGDDPEAKATAAVLIDRIGFDALDTGSLAEGGRRQQPGTPAYNRALTRAEAEVALKGPG